MIDFAGRDLLSSLDFTPEEVRALLAFARDIKAGRLRPSLAGKVATLLFFNPSVRTRVSCESALARFGGTGITLAAGKDTWNFECGEGVVMDKSTQEHVRELAPVLSRMGHFVGIRKSELITVGLDRSAVSTSYAELAKDEFLHRFSASARPCSGCQRFDSRLITGTSANSVKRCRNSSFASSA